MNSLKLFTVAVATLVFAFNTAIPMKRTRDLADQQTPQELVEQEMCERESVANQNMQNLTTLHEHLRDQLLQLRRQERERNSHFVLLPPQTNQHELVTIWEYEMGDLPAANRGRQTAQTEAEDNFSSLLSTLQHMTELLNTFTHGLDHLFAHLESMNLSPEQRQEAINNLIESLPVYLPAELTTCAICQDEDDGSQTEWVRLPQCKHAFHKNCIKPWLVQKRNCPQCRTDIQ